MPTGSSCTEMTDFQGSNFTVKAAAGHGHGPGHHDGFEVMSMKAQVRCHHDSINLKSNYSDLQCVPVSGFNLKFIMPPDSEDMDPQSLFKFKNLKMRLYPSGTERPTRREGRRMDGSP